MIDNQYYGIVYTFTSNPFDNTDVYADLMKFPSNIFYHKLVAPLGFEPNSKD
jgi:hypothetical protein